MDNGFNFENYNGIFGMHPNNDKWYNHYVNREYAENLYQGKQKDKARCLLLRKESELHGEQSETNYYQFDWEH